MTFDFNFLARYGAPLGTRVLLRYKTSNYRGPSDNCTQASSQSPLGPTSRCRGNTSSQGYKCPTGNLNIN
ncbi:hypothetical protein J6590_004060 [Homalodisca vitripennis]|nr:hypothetical protein J6590_004060 [Homalodisca vitripennis]